MQKTEISREVRKAVYERDSWDDVPCCVYCGRPYPEVHHFVERSRGGMGIEQNLVCLCTTCHRMLHNGDVYIKGYVELYLKDKYPGWDERALIVRERDK